MAVGKEKQSKDNISDKILVTSLLHLFANFKNEELDGGRFQQLTIHIIPV